MDCTLSGSVHTAGSEGKDSGLGAEDIRLRIHVLRFRGWGLGVRVEGRLHIASLKADHVADRLGQKIGGHQNKKGKVDG